MSVFSISHYACFRSTRTIIDIIHSHITEVYEYIVYTLVFWVLVPCPLYYYSNENQCFKICDRMNVLIWLCTRTWQLVWRKLCLENWRLYCWSCWCLLWSTRLIACNRLWRSVDLCVYVCIFWGAWRGSVCVYAWVSCGGGGGDWSLPVCHVLWVKGLGTDEETLLEILCTQSGKQLQEISACYRHCKSHNFPNLSQKMFWLIVVDLNALIHNLTCPAPVCLSSLSSL